MSAQPTPLPPLPPLTAPVQKLVFNIEELCNRTARGQPARKSWFVRLHVALRILSIVLTSLGSVGVIVAKASANLPGESGAAFWGSVVLLIFGILSQVANEFQIAQLATDARALAEKCDVYDTRLANVLLADDPRQATVAMLVEVNELFESERYNKVLPPESKAIVDAGMLRSRTLILKNLPHWDLQAPPQPGLVAQTPAEPPPAPAPAVVPMPPGGAGGV
jgi:hypothetical protein